jgi:hypothetical protein
MKHLPHIVSTFTWLIAIIYCPQEKLVVVSVCAGVFFMSEISFVLKQLVEQNKKDAEELIRSNEARTFELTKAICKDKKWD